MKYLFYISVDLSNHCQFQNFQFPNYLRNISGAVRMISGFVSNISGST